MAIYVENHKDKESAWYCIIYEPTLTIKLTWTCEPGVETNLYLVILWLILSILYSSCGFLFQIRCIIIIIIILYFFKVTDRYFKYKFEFLKMWILANKKIILKHIYQMPIYCKSLLFQSNFGIQKWKLYHCCLSCKGYLVASLMLPSSPITHNCPAGQYIPILPFGGWIA